MKSPYHIEALVDIYDDDGEGSMLEDLGIATNRARTTAKMTIDCTEISEFVEMKGEMKGWTQIKTYHGDDYCIKIPYKEMFGIVSSFNPIKSFL
jgi:hypothetical protein